MFKRGLALLLCLLLLPCWALADAADGVQFSLQFVMNTEAYPEELQDIIPGVADLLAVTTIDGTLLTRGDQFDLQLGLMLNEQLRSRAELNLFGTKSAWYVTSPLLGDETLCINMVALLEFMMKGYSYLDIPFQRVGILMSPFVHENGVSPLVDAAKPILYHEAGSRTVPYDAIMSLADQLANTAETNREFRYWTEALFIETGYDQVLMDMMVSLPEWLESFVPRDGVTITVDESGEIWTAGPTTLLRRETDQSGAQALSVTLPPMPDGLTLTLDAATQPDGSLLHGSLDLLITYDGEETVLRLHTDGSLPTTLDVTRPFFLNWEAEGPAVGGEGVHLCFEGEADGSTYTLRQMLPDRSATMLTITAEMTAVQGDFTLDEEPQGVNLLSVNGASLNGLMAHIASPLIRGVLPLIAQAPITTCQMVMNLLESSGVFDMLTVGFYSEGDEWDDEDW